MTALRIINLIVWGALLLYMLPGAWAAARARVARHGDPMRLAVAANSIVMMGFTARWLWAPDNNQMWKTLYVLSAMVAVYIAYLARGYGRGPRV